MHQPLRRQTRRRRCRGRRSRHAVRRQRHRPTRGIGAGGAGQHGRRLGRARGGQGGGDEVADPRHRRHALQAQHRFRGRARRRRLRRLPLPLRRCRISRRSRRRNCSSRWAPQCLGGGRRRPCRRLGARERLHRPLHHARMQLLQRPEARDRAVALVARGGPQVGVVRNLGLFVLKQPPQREHLLPQGLRLALRLRCISCRIHALARRRK
mmetsp:Transcript_57006/g.185272  ORF Transcript_57006/g.185272 Transcript_57006/m.185272 type:complete len:210 (-) Transcript_57006:158-787(-)